MMGRKKNQSAVGRWLGVVSYAKDAVSIPFEPPDRHTFDEVKLITRPDWVHYVECSPSTDDHFDRLLRAGVMLVKEKITWEGNWTGNTYEV
jgi:hypothetical protein